MNPQVGQPMPQQNPFMQLLQKLQSQGGQQAPGQNMPQLQAAMQRSAQPSGSTPPSQPGGAPISALAQASGAAGQASGLPGVTQPDVEDAAIPGQNPGISKNLLGALQQLHGAITSMSDPEEIRMIRSIILMLTQLIQTDQQKQNTSTGRSMSTGQPAGAPNPAM